MKKTVLFLCTGNYYRSRFSEHLFNYLAEDAKLNWRADSKGLALEVWENPGPISPYTEKRLAQLAISQPSKHREPEAVTYGDLRKADLIVALKEVEHRPLLDRKFPGWSSQTRFWHVHDVADLEPDRALEQMEQLVAKLVLELRETR
jgi:protein-tyrosine phosphatase